MPGSSEAMPGTTPPKSSTKTRRAKAAQRRPSPQRVEDKPSSAMPSSLSLAVLLVGLGLAASNLWLMTGKVGSLSGLEQAWTSLLGNYASRRTEPAPIPTTPPPHEESVKLLYSVSGNEPVVPGMQEKIADPIVDYYKLTGAKLDAVLIERKKPLSQFVRVRLFFAGGTEQEFLWPFSDSPTDWWVPPCSLDGIKNDLPQCPADFLSKYPAIAHLIAMKKK